VVLDKPSVILTQREYILVQGKTFTLKLTGVGAGIASHHFATNFQEIVF